MKKFIKNTKDFFHITNPKNWTNVIDRKHIGTKDYSQRLSFLNVLDLNSRHVCEMEDGCIIYLDGDQLFYSDGLYQHKDIVIWGVRGFPSLHKPKYNKTINNIATLILKMRTGFLLRKLTLAEILALYVNPSLGDTVTRRMDLIRIATPKALKLAKKTPKKKVLDFHYNAHPFGQGLVIELKMYPIEYNNVLLGYFCTRGGKIFSSNDFYFKSHREVVDYVDENFLILKNQQL